MNPTDPIGLSPSAAQAAAAQPSAAGGDILALAIEIAKRAADQSGLDDLYFLLVNEFRCILEFDRCFLIVHLGGSSELVAASHQPAIESKSPVYQDLSALAPKLKELKKGILLTKNAQDQHFPADVASEELKSALISYIRQSQCSHWTGVPLVHRGAVAGHLVFEFHTGRGPTDSAIVALLNVAPLLAAALAEHWLLHKKPRIAGLLDPEASQAGGVLSFQGKRWRFVAALAAFVAIAAFCVPVDYTAGGEAVVVPSERQVAFCRVDGLIQRVAATEGAQVKQDQVLAYLDPTEHDFRMDTARRKAEILTRRIALVRREADSAPAKLGDLKILQLEREKILKEIDHIKWESDFILIKSPTDGTVVTKDVQTLAGKKLKGGDPFCEIVKPSSLIAEIFVPEDRISLVKTGQTGRMYLNTDPMTGHRLVVDEISPAAEPIPGLGNGCRVRAKFASPPPGLRMGMKGVGKIDAGGTTLGTLIVQGAATRWNRYSLYW
jgi:hypothetical protein